MHANKLSLSTIDLVADPEMNAVKETQSVAKQSKLRGPLNSFCGPDKHIISRSSSAEGSDFGVIDKLTGLCVSLFIYFYKQTNTHKESPICFKLFKLEIPIAGGLTLLFAKNVKVKQCRIQENNEGKFKGSQQHCVYK